jgi:hypothetical protein
MGIGMRGRHGKQVLIDGDIMELRSLINMGETKVVSLPKMWLELVARKGELKGVGILENGESLIIRPYYGEKGV